MKSTRRSFILASGAFAFGAGRAMAQSAKTNLRIGVVSDIHIMKKGLPDELYIYGSDTIFRKTLKYFRERKVDAVIIAGDMANTGLIKELNLVANAWKEIFPGNKGADGARVEPVFIYGNHDAASWGNKNVDQLINSDPAGVWKRAFGWDYSPVGIVDVKGYKFVTVNWGHGKELPQFLEAHRNELKGSKPFFYVQHIHPAGTLTSCSESDTTVSDALSKFPNAVAFSGHSHESLALDNVIWQGAYTSIGTSALSYISLPSNCVDNHESPATSPMPWASDLGKDAMIVDVLDNGVLSIESRQMVDDEPLCAVRMVAVPPRGGDESWAFNAQRARAVAPEFPAGAKITEWREQGVSRVTSIQNQVVLTFPAAQIVKGNGRAVTYRIEVFKDGEDKPVHSSNIVAPLYFRAPKRAPKIITARIPTSALPEETLTYKVAAVDCWGNAGKSLSLRVEV